MRSKNEQLTHTNVALTLQDQTSKNLRITKSLRYCKCTRTSDRKPVLLQQVWQAEVHKSPLPYLQWLLVTYVMLLGHNVFVLLAHNLVCTNKRRPALEKF